jgi:phosphoribosylaminoimidazole-succinocarboxamide synthase
MVDDATLRAALRTTLARTDFDALGAKYEGKVRDNYSPTTSRAHAQSGRRFIVVTDRISAFDRVLGTIPFKGQVLSNLSAWWFDKTRTTVPNHLVSLPDPNVLECIECEPVMAEFVVRAYVTGSTSTSIWTHYEKGARVFCGHRLPDGLKKNQKLPAPILTPATKAPKGEHDVSGSREEILKAGKVNAEDFDRAAEMAMKLFAEGQRVCAERGLILVDTKYEFGKTPEGEIVVIDEIHTPDSSRFWYSDSYETRFGAGLDPESFDKEYVRRFLVDQGYRGEGAIPTIPDDVRVEATRRYIEAVDRITGAPFVPNLEEPAERMQRNLRALGLPA